MLQRDNRPESKTESPNKASSPIPSISLPKGGGAIRGIGEKFAANPVTGTGSLSVPIYTSPGRSGFGPQLSLSYDSGAGNGPFGFGWSLSLPSITRKTDKGLPKYQDAVESDVFILSGAEDLVPVPVEIGGQQYDEFPRTVNGVDYLVKRYRPRIEGLFARIERWTRDSDGDTHWRSISKDNVTTLYGKDNNSRIFDPSDLDSECPKRIFSWLICESYDDKGNVIVYEYEEENSDSVDLSQAHEQNRSKEARSTNRYLKHIKYGNRAPYYPSFDENSPPTPLPSEWLFEVVFDYGEHDPDDPKPDDNDVEWFCRHDPFSSYRAGFEVRTYRLCQRVLMFHHFPGEEGVGQNCLVRSTDFVYRNIRDNPDDLKKGHPVASFIASITQSGYRRQAGGGYLKKSLPPLEFEYSQVPNPEQLAQQPIQEVDAESLENLPVGLDGASYQWVDLDGEGLSGILTEQAGSWFYKRNLSPANIKRDDGRETVLARLAPAELVVQKPSLANVSGGQQQFLDLAGDGQIDLVQFAQPLSGYYERTQDESWSRFVPFESVPNLAWGDPNLKFVDLTGDGHADILVTEDQVFTWYLSLAEAGFGPAQRAYQALDEETGPRLVFADPTQSIYLADLSGDGLTDLARVRNGAVCYWPNLGYGRFGAKVTMDDAPWFDHPDQFDQRRVRLADIDGSGTTDIIYLGRDGVDLYFNQAGNGWSKAQTLTHFPRTDNLSSVMAVDLLGNGTACLVWSSPLPGDAQQPMRYLDLMGGQKPHLLVKVVNNLGAETRVQYAPSTRFYLADKEAGRPWITKLPFPVHVVERVEVREHVTGSKLVSLYKYHHGYFDGVEREFRGFGLVEQWDTESFPQFTGAGLFPSALAVEDEAEAQKLHLPPVHTKTWFHTGAYIDRDHISQQYVEEYYDGDSQAVFLPDTILPPGLSAEEEREACRALKGRILRQEVYALDHHPDKGGHPYTISETNYHLIRIQPLQDQAHAVFYAHERETLSYHYERDPDDPRVIHAMTLHVDDYGNVTKSVAIGYPRRAPAHPEQGQTQITYTEADFFNLPDEEPNEESWYRIGVPCETRTYELTGFEPSTGPTYSLADFVNFEPRVELRYDRDLTHEESATSGRERRLIEHVRTLYYKDDLSGPLSLGKVDPLALPYETYRLAFTPELLKHILVDSSKITAAELAGVLKSEGGYRDLDGDGHWWNPSGLAIHSPVPDNPPSPFVQDADYARQHFYLPQAFQDPFGNYTRVRYDGYDLLIKETRDPLYNVMTVVTQDDEGNDLVALDYRVLQPWLVVDPNHNRSAVAFDALGMVVGTAVMGKRGENVGDSLAGFEGDLDESDIVARVDRPLYDSHAILKEATTRLVYDVWRYHRTQQVDENGEEHGQPAVVWTLVREIHAADQGGQETPIQHSFLYSDGLGREVQTKIQAESGPTPVRDPETGQVVMENGKPKMTEDDTDPRWVGAGRTVYDNKGNPVKQYEPFFSHTHLYEGEQTLINWGVTPILRYDPLSRLIRTDNPNGTFSQGEFAPWQQTTCDENDTALESLWYAERGSPDPYAHWTPADPERRAAYLAAQHADTPTVQHLDVLGRPFLSVARNREIIRNDLGQIVEIIEYDVPTHTQLDIEGNALVITDARGNRAMEYLVRHLDDNGDEVLTAGYDVSGRQLYQNSMDAGERWTLSNVAGNPIRGWDSRGHTVETRYDGLQRPTHLYVRQGTGPEILAELTVYGEKHPRSDQLNLRGRAFLQFDPAGVVVNTGHSPSTGEEEGYDFKGNLLRSSRRLAGEYRGQVDWSPLAPLADVAEIDVQGIMNEACPLLMALLPDCSTAYPFTTSTTYDALNRPVTLTTPDMSVIRPTYNEANLLEKVDVNLRGADEPTPFVSDIDYNAKGQRELIDYHIEDHQDTRGVVRTQYDYDPLTFRLIHLTTKRTTDDRWLQDLRYTYDPVGNITGIRDDAQQNVFFDNEAVTPHANYVYDALYRLIWADGREHAGQNGCVQPEHTDMPRMGLPHPNDPRAMRRYTQKYDYDEVGNILRMVHLCKDSASRWTRRYDYAEDSNRLLSTGLPGDPDDGPYSATYDYDAHGNMIKMPHLTEMKWDFKDQLQEVKRAAGGTVYYVYDATGQRVRKVYEHNGSTVEERIYLGGYEIYRKSNDTGLKLERETLHVMDGPSGPEGGNQQRIALVETKTADNGLLSRLRSLISSPDPLIRYQFGNHLGSACLELDAAGEIITYEEYHPYGSTSYQAVRSQTEMPKRYRYSGKERDKESGLYYYGARYYAGWLGRWCSCDPAGFVDGWNLYLYTQGNPLRWFDSKGMNSQESSLAVDSLINLNFDENEDLHASRFGQNDKGVYFHPGFTSEQAELAKDIAEEGYEPGRAIEWYKKLVESQGGVWLDEANQLNVVGLRGYDLREGRNTNEFNEFNDTLAFIWKDNNDDWHIIQVAASTEPGVEGAVHLAPGQYPYIQGIHRGTPGALTPALKQSKRLRTRGYRDTDESGTISLRERTNSIARNHTGRGIQIHWSGGSFRIRGRRRNRRRVVPKRPNNWSEGCQVAAFNRQEFREKLSPLFEGRSGGILYTLIDVSR